MKTNFLFALITSTLLLVSCSSDNVGTQVLNEVRVDFTSGISATPTRDTKAIDNKWEGNEHIGVYMLKKGSSDISENAENVEYVTTSIGTTASFTSSTPIYYPVNAADKVDFIAYNPYHNTLANFTYKVDLENQSNQSAIDLLIAKANNNGVGYDKNNTGAVNLIFNHKLSKLMLHIKAGDGVTDLNGMTVTIKGMNTKADFKLYTQEFLNWSDPKNIMPTLKEEVYEAILLPTVLGTAQVIEFKVGANTYTWTMSNDIATKSLVSGSKYIYEVTISKTGVGISGTIQDWNSVEGSGVAN